jgi:hypothetical protein
MSMNSITVRRRLAKPRVPEADGEVLKKETKPARAGEEGQWDDYDGEEVIVTSDPATLTNGQEVGSLGGSK